MKWETGSATIERLLQAGELRRVSADRAIAEGLLTASRNHLSSAEAIRASDAVRACQMGYDAVRKACSALLETQGLRATSHGGHVALGDAIRAQFEGHAGGEVLRRFDLIRRRRNDLEYPDSDFVLGDEDVEITLVWAEDIVTFAEKVVDHLSVF